MVMCFYWGFAPSHVYTHGTHDNAIEARATEKGVTSAKTLEPGNDEDRGLEDHSEDAEMVPSPYSDADILEDDEDYGNEDYFERDDASDDDSQGDSENDEDVLAWNEMYGND